MRPVKAKTSFQFTSGKASLRFLLDGFPALRGEDNYAALLFAAA